MSSVLKRSEFIIVAPTRMGWIWKMNTRRPAGGAGRKRGGEPPSRRASPPPLRARTEFDVPLDGAQEQVHGEDGVRHRPEQGEGPVQGDEVIVQEGVGRRVWENVNHHVQEPHGGEHRGEAAEDEGGEVHEGVAPALLVGHVAALPVLLEEVDRLLEAVVGAPVGARSPHVAPLGGEPAADLEELARALIEEHLLLRELLQADALGLVGVRVNEVEGQGGDPDAPKHDKEEPADERDHRHDVDRGGHPDGEEGLRGAALAARALERIAQVVNGEQG
mmetsp:Transcript_18516/g.62035  ORF Transcript_18516/g.62035 Transcript_18516/m.62035 type:complete len:276 (-) Transcript_18516:574-1401(-)